MSKRIFLLMSLILAVAVVAWSSGDAFAQKKATTNDVAKKFGKLSPAEQKAAAERAKKLGLKPGVAGFAPLAGNTPLPGIEGPGGVPHYFGPYGNWAFSPLPKGPVAVVTLVDGGTGYSQPVVTIGDAYGTGSGASINATADASGAVVLDLLSLAGGAIYSAPVVTITDTLAGTGLGAGASINATADASGAVVLDPLTLVGSANYSAPVVTITDTLAGTGIGATATATVDPVTGTITTVTLLTGGSGYTAPVVTITDTPLPGPGIGAIADAVIGGPFVDGSGMLKFIDPLPGLWDPRNGPAPEKSIPLAVPDIVTYPGSHYYEIALRNFSEKMHSSLPATKMRGYVQINNGTNVYDAVTNPAGCVPPGQPLPDPSLHFCTAADNTIAPAPIRYLGPVIVAQGRVHGIEGTNPAAGKPVPVRIKFNNELPTGAGGNLFIPVDETIMGAGYGPAGPGTAGEKYTQNRATIHLHGNNTVWISDGNVHQWITPAGETTSYPSGVSARNVPDMGPSCDADPVNAPGLPGSSGCQTFFYTNAQSARLQFYHDHAMGITRLNVYAGEAAGYVLTDAVEQDMINGTNVSGVNPDGLKVLPDIGIPLVIQDRTFVDANTIFA